MNWLMNGSALSGWRAGGGDGRLSWLIICAENLMRTVFGGLLRPVVGWLLQGHLTNSSHKTYYANKLSDFHAKVKRTLECDRVVGVDRREESGYAGAE